MDVAQLVIQCSTLKISVRLKLSIGFAFLHFNKTAFGLKHYLRMSCEFWKSNNLRRFEIHPSMGVIGVFIETHRSSM
jgi:hypothetical protein